MANVYKGRDSNANMKEVVVGGGGGGGVEMVVVESRDIFVHM